MSVAFEQYGLDFWQPDDSRKTFVDQLAASDLVAKKLKNQIGTLKRTIEADPSSSSKDSDIVHKFQSFSAAISVYFAVKRMLKLRDVVMEPRYEEADDGSDEKEEMSQTYLNMAKVLRVYADGFEKMLKAPDGWFRVQACRLTTWLQDNPATAATITLGLGTLSGAAAGCHTYYMGHCLIYYIWAGSSCSCPSWGVGASIAAGAGVGLVVTAVIVAIVGLSLTYYTYEDASQRQAEEVRAVNAMAKQMETMSNDEVKHLLAKLLACSTRVLPVAVVDEDDRRCIICLGEQQDVQIPVRAPRCRGKHFMCKQCWVRVLTSHGDKCPVCRV